MILDKIVDDVKIRLIRDMKKTPLEELRKNILRVNNCPGFFESLKAPGLSVIAEFKKASPSAGIIDDSADPVQKAKSYVSQGASAISVLTERDHFLGSLEDLEKVVAAISIPVLRKDFIVDPYQVYEAKIMGASAFLLIAAILSFDELNALIRLGHMLNMDVLVEVHDEDEIQKVINSDARIIGINNRNLKTFEVNLEVSRQLRPMIPEGIVSVCESGIRNSSDFDFCRSIGFDAVLIGEAMMSGGITKEDISSGRVSL